LRGIDDQVAKAGLRAHPALRMSVADVTKESTGFPATACPRDRLPQQPTIHPGATIPGDIEHLEQRLAARATELLNAKRHGPPAPCLTQTSVRPRPVSASPALSSPAPAAAPGRHPSLLFVLAVVPP
jgi:hypothetical protein